MAAIPNPHLEFVTRVVWTTNQEYLLAFVTVQSLAGVSAADSTIYKF